MKKLLEFLNHDIVSTGFLGLCIGWSVGGMIVGDMLDGFFMLIVSAFIFRGIRWEIRMKQTNERLSEMVRKQFAHETNDYCMESKADILTAEVKTRLPAITDMRIVRQVLSHELTNIVVLKGIALVKSKCNPDDTIDWSASIDIIKPEKK